MAGGSLDETNRAPPAPFDGRRVGRDGPAGAGPIQNVGQGERVSGIIGGSAAYMLSPRSMVRVCVHRGGGLLYRAFTGHCPVSPAIPRS